MKTPSFTTGLAALTLAFAGFAFAGDLHREHKMMVKLDTGDAEVIEADITDLEIGESRSFVTDSGRSVDMIRTADGMEVYIDGELLDMDFHGDHGNNVVLHDEFEIECHSDGEEEDCTHDAIFISDTGDLHEIDGDHIKVIRKSIEVVCDEDSEDCDTNVWVAEGDDVDVLHEAHGEGHKVIRIHKKD